MAWQSVLTRSILAILLVSPVSKGLGQLRIESGSQESILRKLPPGLSVIASAEIPAANRDAIGAKLGGTIERLSNSTLRVHGQPIKVNVIVAADDTSADALWAALNRIKKPPFLHREGRRIVEYVANDEALARKTTWELGLEPKPKAVRYRVTAELATIDKPDDMAANPLFQACLAQSRQSSPETLAKIAELAAKFAFGKSLVLRNPAEGGESVVRFEPEPVSGRASGAKIVYEFAVPSQRHGIPFVTANIATTVTDPAISKPAAGAPIEPDARSTAATPRWPVDDPAIRELAASITAGMTEPGAKVNAILAWLTPGKHMRYEGQTGSRWGTKKALNQKFGHCWDFSDLFVTLARSAGVPARQVAGWLYGSSGHVWAEWYEPRRGWSPVDPTGGSVLPCGIYHIPYFTTDDGEMPIVYVSMPKIEIVETR